MSAATDEQMAAQIMELVHPATLAQVNHFHQLGLRERILTLPVMMALVLSLIWRQIGSVCELTRLVQSEALLWAQPLPRLTEKAMATRLRTLPAVLFWRVLDALLPLMQARWAARQRPLPPEVAWAQARYSEVVACDGSTLDALLITTNDNLHALQFYQKRGLSLVAVYRNAVEQARKIKPEIPLLGANLIPLRDEIELEMPL